MKNVIYIIAFVAAVAAYAYPPVTEPNGNESPAVLYRIDVGTDSDNPRWIPPEVVYVDVAEAVDDASDVMGAWPVPRPTENEDPSVWIGATSEEPFGEPGKVASASNYVHWTVAEASYRNEGRRCVFHGNCKWGYWG